MEEPDDRDVVGGFSVRRDGSYTAPQAVGVVDDGKLVVHELSPSFHYYFVPGFVGMLGFSLFRLPGLLVGVLVGTLLMLWGKKYKYKRGVRKVERGADLSNDIVVKRGKVRKVEVDEGKFRKTLHVETPKYNFLLIGDSEDVERVKEVLV